MEPDSLPTDLILTEPPGLLGQVYLDDTPQPGAWVDYEGNRYTVLERRHRYRLQANRYQLHKIALYVQKMSRVEQPTYVGDRWVIGDASCTYNAQSELIRCAVNPLGPCEGCEQYWEGGGDGG